MTTTRNRWLYTAGAAVACAAVLVTANVALASRTPAAGPALIEAGAAPSAQPSVAETKPAADKKPSGTVIGTGLKSGGGEWVLYAEPIDEPQIPKIDFGVMLGLRTGAGDPVDAVMANETEGSATAPGFHAVQGSMEIDLGRTPTFGYYAGPAAKITAKVDGRTVTAKQAPLDDTVQVFWFDAESVKKLAAYDAKGKKLPTGDSTVGVG
jgi:hypothetical protein